MQHSLLPCDFDLMLLKCFDNFGAYASPNLKKIFPPNPYRKGKVQGGILNPQEKVERLERFEALRLEFRDFF